MHLTNIQIKNAKPREKMYRLSDGDNLYLEIYPNGNKRWTMAYRHNNKRKQIALGSFKLVPLSEARNLRTEKRKLLLQGIDPVEAKRQEKLERELRHDNNFEAISLEWHKECDHSQKWKPKHAQTILSRLHKHIFPVIGKRPITEITPPEILKALKPIEEAGNHHTAHRMKQVCGQIFRYAVACGRAERDITQDLRGAIQPSKSNPQKHLEEKELPDFLQQVNRYDLSKEEGGCNGNPITKWAMQLIVLNFTRPGELRGAKWEEIEWDKKQWRIPAERMKMKEQHIVPLSDQSIKLFRKIQEVTGDCYSGFVFPSFQNPRKPISDGTLAKLIKLIGYKGKVTPHGFRHTASTILNENGYNKDWIERELAHGDRDQIRATYNYAQYLPQRAEMMQWYADHIEKLGMIIDG